MFDTYRKILVIAGIIFCLFSCIFIFPTQIYAAGEIVAWGDNSYGQCNVPSPNTDFTAIAAGGRHTLGLKTDGSIAAWGYNNFGQCDAPSPNTDFMTIAANGEHSLGLKTDGSIMTWGENYYGECTVPEPNTGFTAIATSYSHTLGLKTDGSIFAWGDDFGGQCTVPEPNTGFVAIAAGWEHSLGLKTDGSIVAWGWCGRGQCDVPSPNTGFTAIAAGAWHSLGLKTDGSIVAWGYNYYGQCNVPSPNTGFTAIAAGGHHSLGLVAKYSGGSGTEADPYQIADTNDLLALTDTPTDYNKCFILTVDIDMEGQVFTTAIIAADTSSSGGFQGTAFTGTFDGNGHKITNFTINGGGSGYIGLFGRIDNGGSVKNLGLEDFSVSGHGRVGGLVGESEGMITDCYATGAVSGDYSVGGLVGRNYSGGIVAACYSTGLVTGSNNGIETGGLVGANYEIITVCYATGAVSGVDSVGGLVGYNYRTIANCYATGTIDGNDAVGGLVGFNDGYGIITTCYAVAAVYGNNSVGGLMGGGTGTIINCYSTGAVAGNDYVGGLAGGSATGITITNCYATGAVSGNNYVGGMVGYDDNGTTKASFWDVNTSGQATSAGGEGKTTAEMKTLSTFTSAGWDFVGETANGTEDIWTICEGVNYPKFVWQNQPPIAEAGADQTVYAWIDGIAGITLDGSDSNDPDGDELTYKWTWVIDSNTYEANGVNPTIELPIGVHTIQLIVNDGLADSVPDDVNITVIAPLKSKLEIMPRIINRFSHNHHRPEKILAFVRLPEGIAKKDISNEPLTLYPGDIEASRQWIIPIPYGFGRHKKWLTGILAFFDKDDVLDAIPTNGRVELEVAGELTSGRYFYGSDTVIIIGPKRWK